MQNEYFIKFSNWGGPHIWHCDPLDLTTLRIISFGKARKKLFSIFSLNLSVDHGFVQ